MRSSFIICICSAIALPPSLYNHHTHCSNDNNTSLPLPSPSPSVIALYLTPKSKSSIEAYLSGVGYKGYSADYVVIKRLTRISMDTDVARYQQYYGDKAAFRLKGVIKTDNGLVVVTSLITHHHHHHY